MSGNFTAPAFSAGTCVGRQGLPALNNIKTNLGQATNSHPPNIKTKVYKRIPLVVRYTACGGLFNQHYSHVAALSLALALGADVILPAAVKRDSFANYFSQVRRMDAVLLSFEDDQSRRWAESDNIGKVF